jgi:CheY-like chemotaxis protein
LKAYDIKTSGIHLEKILNEHVPPVFADPSQLQQVLLNVINNAQDAVLLQPEQPTISIRTEVRTETVVITVSDNGPGIPRSELKKVFDPFFTTKPVGKGTGLGLSISYGIIREHNGDIRIQSEPGEGTQVTIELPIDKREFKRADPSPAPLNARRSMRILVVDDEAEIVNVLSAGFVRGGIIVDTACSVRDAVLLATATLYDFVVTDVKMPGGSGIDLYKQLCSLNPKYRERTVFLTGDISNTRTTKFFESEGVAYFSKPFDFEALDSFFQRKVSSVPTV